MYFDYTSTTPMDLDVLETYNRVQKYYFANTESLHKLGRMSDDLLEKAKREIKETLGIDKEIIFTHNATEANNLAIFGIVGKKKGKIITTKIEHPSVFEVFKYLESIGYDVVYLDILENGKIDLNQLEIEMDKDVLLVSIMWVNNIIGSIQPIKEVIEIIKKYPKCKLHVDAVQGMCKIVPDFNFNDIDLFTISAHKFYGPKGVGCLFYNKNIMLEKHIYGSNVQRGIKPGTIDLAGIAALCKAIKKFYPTTIDRYKYVKTLYNYLYEEIKNVEGIYINSINENSPYIMSISIPAINSETVIHILDEKNIYVSSGSACSSKLKKAEKTVLAVTKDEQRALTAIRISFSHLITMDEVQILAKALKEIK